MGYAIIAAVVVFTLFGLGRWADIMRRHRARQDRIPEEQAGAVDGPVVERKPGRLRRQAWFAVAVGDAGAFARTLGLRTARTVGLDAADDAVREGLFVVDAGGGRVLAVGLDAFARGDFARIDDALERLSTAHGEAMWFALDEDRDLCGWARARRGEVLRAYCFDGTDDELLWEVGDPTADEVALGFFAADPRDGTDDPVKWWPLPRDVRALAERWGAQPSFAAGGPAEGGLAGRW